MDVLHWLNQHHVVSSIGMAPAIIPTVLIPLTALTVGVTSLAGLVAGWFGIKLHTEGPKQLLEVMLKKRVLISMMIVNILGIGVYKSYIYVHTLPSFLYTIAHHSKTEALASNEFFPDARSRKHEYVGSINSPTKFSLQLLKEAKINIGAFRSGVISGNSIFYGSDDGYIYEMDKESLAVKRKYFIGTMVTTRPIIYKNRLFAGEGNHLTHHARIYSFDLQSGNFLNAFQTKGHTEGQPVIESFNNTDIMFLTAGSDGLYAVSPIDMKEIWHKKDGHLDASVTVDNGVVYAGTGVEKGFEKDRSFATAYEFGSGKELWKKELPLSNWMHPVVTKEDVCFVLGEIYTPSTIGLFYCLNKIDGTPHFSIPIDSPIASKPYYIHDKNNDEYVFFGSMSGEVCGVDINKKEKMWCKKTAQKPTKSALSSLDYDELNSVLWYPTSDNGLMALAPKTGMEVFHWTPSIKDSPWADNAGSVSLDADHLYHMDLDGRLRMFKIAL